MLPGIHASKRIFPANTSLLPDSRVHRICVVLAGSFAHAPYLNGRSFDRGAVVFRPIIERHPIRFGAAGMRSLTIEISPEEGEVLFQAGVLPNKPMALTCPDCLLLATRVMDEIASPLPSSRLVATGLMLEIIGQVSRSVSDKPGTKPLWLRGVVNLIRSEFRNPASLAEYAAYAGVHPVTLAHAFRKYEGVSIGGFVRRLRLRHAAELLTSSGADLTHIALESGFADHSHMTRSFRHHLGMSPSAYRRVRCR